MVGFRKIKNDINMEKLIEESIEDSQARRKEIAEVLREVYENLETSYELNRKTDGNFITSENQFMVADCSSTEMNFTPKNYEFNMRIDYETISFSVKPEYFLKYKHFLLSNNLGRKFFNQIAQKIITAKNIFPKDYMIMAVVEYIDDTEDGDLGGFFKEFDNMSKI